MGRHGRPDAFRRTHRKVIQAAAAVGVLGTAAFTFQTVTAEPTVRATSDGHTRFDPVTDDADPSHAGGPGTGGSSASGDRSDSHPGASEPGGPRPSASAAPRLIDDGSSPVTATTSSDGQVDTPTGNEAAATPGGRGRSAPHTGTSARRYDAPTATPSTEAPSAPSSDQDGGASGNDTDEEQDGPVESTVNTVGGAVGQVVAGLGGLLG